MLGGHSMHPLVPNNFWFRIYCVQWLYSSHHIPQGRSVPQNASCWIYSTVKIIPSPPNIAPTTTIYPIPPLYMPSHYPLRDPVNTASCLVTTRRELRHWSGSLVLARPPSLIEPGPVIACTTPSNSRLSSPAQLCSYRLSIVFEVCVYWKL